MKSSSVLQTLENSIKWRVRRRWGAIYFYSEESGKVGGDKTKKDRKLEVEREGRGKTGSRRHINWGKEGRRYGAERFEGGDPPHTRK